MALSLPALIGVIHLDPLPDSPRYRGNLRAVIEGAAKDARALIDAGFEGIIVENFGDAPFHKGPVSAVTVAAMTACALAVRSAAPSARLGINVLRNDAAAALSIALAAGGDFVRINVHIGARVTDQGVIEGDACGTLRLRRAIGAEHVGLLCDVDVKHSAPLASRPIAEEAHDLVERGLADGVLVTGTGTGRGVDTLDLETVLEAVRVPVWVASGATLETLPGLQRAHGIIVGTTLRASGRPGDPVDPELAKRFADAFRSQRDRT